MTLRAVFTEYFSSERKIFVLPHCEESGTKNQNDIGIVLLWQATFCYVRKIDMVVALLLTLKGSRKSKK